MTINIELLDVLSFVLACSIGLLIGIIAIKYGNEEDKLWGSN